jgi:3-methylcrotonyl-CoA carboxylase beta subunit
MSVLQTQLNSRSADFLANAAALQSVVDDLRVQLKSLRQAAAKKPKPNTWPAANCPRANACKCCSILGHPF